MERVVVAETDEQLWRRAEIRHAVLSGYGGQHTLQERREVSEIQHMLRLSLEALGCHFVWHVGADASTSSGKEQESAGSVDCER